MLCWILCVILTFLALERGETEMERAKERDYSETESRCVCRRSLCHTGLVDHIKCRSYVRLGLICVCPHHDVLCLTNNSDLSCCSNINCEINHVVWKMPFWCLFSPGWRLYSCRSHFPQSLRISWRTQHRHRATNESRNWLRRVNKTVFTWFKLNFKNIV